ncbi:type II secretion system protein [bacterium]|nr:type II secretion system protein [bacterium]
MLRYRIMENKNLKEDNMIKNSSRVDFSLPEKLDCQFAGRRKAAFTLAEVLITLGIIGIVAAMTLPALIANHQKTQTATRLKRAYNVISNAIQQAKSEHGDVELWELSSSNDIQASSDFANTYLIPYMNVIKKCDTSITDDCTYKPTSMKGTNLGNLPLHTRFVLNDGTLIFIQSRVNDAEHVFPRIVYVNIDINGFKGPNISGKDYFQFAVVLDTTQDMYRFAMHRLYASGQSQTIETIRENCSRNGSGGYCAALIMYNNWRITDDYPW